MPPSAGLRLGRYELQARIGAGGMGEVWRARDHELQRDVAVKFLPESSASDAVRLGRFAQEARAASQLNHPNIVTIHDIGQTSGLHYIVMELVQGQTLRELVADGRPVPVRRLLEIGMQVADGLAKAHGEGIVHRDLKPENVMVTDDGFAKILDFGLAKLRGEPSGGLAGNVDSGAPTWPDAPSPRTAAGVVLGTVGYMSPEQASGRPVDYRTDQFTLGAMLYELATGAPAFRRESQAQTLAAIIEDPPEPIAALNPAVPPPVRWLIEGRCLAKDPAERYASTVDLARELRQLREHLAESGGSMPSRSGARPLRFQPRRWLVPLAAFALFALLALALRAPLDGARRALSREPLPAEKRVAVLPFEAPSGSEEDRATARGLALLLTARLGQLERFQRALWVEPAGNVLVARVTTADAARRAFGSSLVVSGSVVRSGARVVLTAALEDAQRQRVLRAATADSLDELGDAVERMLDLEVGEAGRTAFRATASGDAEASAFAAQALGYASWADGRSALERHEQQASLERAVTIFQRALERDPAYALAYAGLGEANWRLYQLTKDASRVELARRACERALRLNDLLAPVHVSLGVIRAGTGEAEAALADFDRALALDPASSDALREKARALERLDRAKDAEAALLRAVELRPGYWDNHNALGAHYWRRGRYEDAERAFRRVVELAPDNVRGLTNLGGLLVARGRAEEARAVLRRSLAVQPTYGAASNLALLEFDAGRYPEAAQAYEQAVGLDDRDYRVWRNLALARGRVEAERARARDAFVRAAQLAAERLRVDPDDAEVLVALADCEAHLGDAAASRAALRRALAKAPGNVEVTATAAGVHEQLGERAAALAALRRAVAGGYPLDLVLRDPALAALRGDPRFPRAAPAPSGARPQPGS